MRGSAILPAAYLAVRAVHEDRRFSQKFGGRGRRFCRVKSCRRRRSRRCSTKEKFLVRLGRDTAGIIPAFLDGSFLHGSLIL